MQIETTLREIVLQFLPIICPALGQNPRRRRQLLDADGTLRIGRIGTCDELYLRVAVVQRMQPRVLAQAVNQEYEIDAAVDQRLTQPRRRVDVHMQTHLRTAPEECSDLCHVARGCERFDGADEEGSLRFPCSVELCECLLLERCHTARISQERAPRARQRNAPPGAHKELCAKFAFNGLNLLRHRGLCIVFPQCRCSEALHLRSMNERFDIPQFHCFTFSYHFFRFRNSVFLILLHSSFMIP